MVCAGDPQRTLPAAQAGSRAGRAALREGGGGQPPAREACASPACLQERGCAVK